MDRNPEKSKKPVKKKGKKINKSFINKKRKSANDLYKIIENEISSINKKTSSDGDKDVNKIQRLYLKKYQISRIYLIFGINK